MKGKTTCAAIGFRHFDAVASVRIRFSRTHSTNHRLKSSCLPLKILS